jgi:hypothetical protein
VKPSEAHMWRPVVGLKPGADWDGRDATRSSPPPGQ